MEADTTTASAAAGTAGWPRDRHELTWLLTEQIQPMDERRAVMTGHCSRASDRQGGGNPHSVLTCPAGRLRRDECRRRVSAVADPEERALPDEAAYLTTR
jgi:hypothetical protein